MKTGCGTPYYISPEVLTHNYSEACDMWSAGCILYVMLCGYPPFYGDDDREIIENVRKGIFDFPVEEWDDVSDEAKDLIKKLIAPPELRLNSHESLKHVWIKSLAKTQKKERLNNIDVNTLQEYQSHQKLKKAALNFIASQIDTEEVEMLKRKFESIDRNGDGNITLKELREAVKDIENKDEIMRIMSAADLDGSGTINYTEFLAATLQQSVFMREENLRNAFKLFDVNGDGKITVDELKQIIGGNKAPVTISEEMW